MALNDKRQRFVDEYVIDFNGTQAAIRAGYSARAAYSTAERMLRNADIQLAITRRINAAQVRTEITVDYVTSTIRDTIERCRQAEPVKEKVNGEWVENGQYKFDATNVLKGCELLGRHLIMFTDRVQATVETVSEEELDNRIAQLLGKAGAGKSAD